MNIFPNSGASICLAGPQHIAKFNLDAHDLIPCYKKVKAVGGSKLTWDDWDWEEPPSKQPVYICDKVDRFYFGKKGCVDVNILSQVFPFPINSSSQTIPSVATIVNQYLRIPHHKRHEPVHHLGQRSYLIHHLNKTY